MVGLGDTKLKILERLRTHSASITDLADEMGISRTAVHKHLEDLSREGLVRARVEKCEGRGRPKQVFVAVDEQAGYARLCGDLLSHLKELFGAGAVLQVLSRRNERLAEQLSPQLEGLPLPDRLCRLVNYLTEQGYQAHCYQEDGRWYLEQRRCPKLALSPDHAEFCQTELQLYERLLGVPVVREERIAAGGQCCRYRIG